MKATNKGLTEYFKIIRQYIKCHAGEGDAVSARQAVDAITPAAEYGDINAQMLLGKYYSWGYHSDCDNRKAIHWFEKAADNGNAEAAKSLMNLYIEDCPEDINLDERLETARKWYDRWIDILTAKAAKGDSVYKMNLADILLYAEGVPENLLDCFSDDDDKRSLLQAIRLYKDITISDCSDFLKAESYYRMGCAHNDLGEGKKAFLCYKKAAGLNCHEAFARIGDAYRDGNGVEQDDAIARKWYRKGSDIGEITATLKLAECYKNGIGGKQDYAKAMDEYRHLAERLEGRGFKHQAAGIGTALYEIGNMYLKGLGVQPDLKKAIYYFKLAVKKGNNIQAENKLNELL